jgi:hypothetical protein
MPRYSEKAKLIAAAVFGGVVVISGAATAATGSLPLVSHGHSHSTPQSPSDNQGDDQGEDTGTTDTTDTTDSTDTPDANTDSGPTTDHANAVTDAAHNKTVTGKNHGQDVCAVASEQRCVTQGQSAGHRQNSSDSHGNAGANTNATTHRQNGLTTHGKAGANTNATTHRQNGLTTHGKAGLHSHTSG